MKIKHYIILIMAVILLVMINRGKLYASGFISIGSGGVISNSDANGDGETNPGLPLILGFQYSPEYRESWMFDSSFSYISLADEDSGENLFIGTAGVMFIKPFTYYDSNITKSVMKKNSCIGTLLLPLTVMRDTLNNLFQYIIPQHPFAFIDFAVIKETESNLLYGFSAGAGLTSGGIDIKARYTQNIGYENGLTRDIYTAGLEFTLNIPLQKKFLRTEPLID